MARKVLIRKRDGVWKVLVLVRVGGRTFPYASAVAATWADVPAAAWAAWEVAP